MLICMHSHDTFLRNAPSNTLLRALHSKLWNLFLQITFATSLKITFRHSRQEGAITHSRTHNVPKYVCERGIGGLMEHSEVLERGNVAAHFFCKGLHSNGNNFLSSAPSNSYLCAVHSKLWNFFLRIAFVTSKKITILSPRHNTVINCERTLHSREHTHLERRDPSEHNWTSRTHTADSRVKNL